MTSSDNTHESDKAKTVEQSAITGERERDNDARRPDGSTGTSHDSTAQKAARHHGQRKR